MTTPPTFVLKFSCPDQRGIVAAVSTFLAERACNITSSQQFDDLDTGQFFMRVTFRGEGTDTLDSLTAAFGPIGAQFDMDWQLHDAARRTRTLLMVSKFGHCLNDLLYRLSIGALPIEVPAIVSNHREMQPLAEAAGIPFVHLPVTRDTKAEAEAELRAVFAQHDCDLIVLARYMQVLSDAMCRDFSGRVINIHHSFLPSFKGAKPYHQAHARGVKLIGATAHYVTADLDEGPIIEQQVTRVDHTQSPADLVSAGRDVESLVLARAVRWHAEHRILLNGKTTVVFS